MTEQDARGWLAEVEGTAHRNGREPAGPKSWVAIVRTPAAPGRRGKIILAFGSNLIEATQGAERAWQGQWESFGPPH